MSRFSTRSQKKMQKYVGRLVGNKRAASAVEFALIAPLYFLMLSAVLETALTTWFVASLDDGVNQLGNFLQDEAMNRRTPNQTQIRQVACNAVKLSNLKCANLKIGIYSAYNSNNNVVKLPKIIDDRTAALTQRGYIVALGYEWGFSLPSTKLLLIRDKGRTQVQAKAFVSVPERAIR